MPQYKLPKKKGQTMDIHVRKQYQSSDRLRPYKQEMEK